ncbi:MAG: SGNH/GDSL hydrolase family protein [Pirellulales bacterium]
MSKRNLATQIVAAALVIVAANVAVAYLARNSYSRVLLRKAEVATSETDAFIGNSLVRCGIDERAFEAVRPNSQAVNLGLGSTWTLDHYLISRQLKSARLRAVYYGFSDLQLVATGEQDFSTLVGNRALVYYAEPEIAARYFRGNSVWAAVFPHLQYLPMLVERLTVWSKVEKLRRQIGEWGLPKAAVNEFGRVEDFAANERDVTEVANSCRSAVAEAHPIVPEIRDMIQEMRRRNAEVVMVSMPLPSRHRARYYDSPEWRSYLRYVQTLIAAEGASYIDASDWIADEYFTDVLHLNEAGAAEFSTRLAQLMNSRQPAAAP